MRAALIAVGLLVLVAGILAAAVLTGTLAEATRRLVAARAADLLGREVAVAGVGGDPVRGVVLTGVRIGGPAGLDDPLLEVPQVVLRFAVGRLLRDAILGRGAAAGLAAVELDHPTLRLTRDAAGRWNLPAPSRLSGTGGRPLTAPVRFGEGTVVIRDAFGRPTPFVARFERVTGSVSLRHLPRVEVALDAVNTDGRTPALVSLTGRLAPARGRADLRIRVRGASAAHWGPYLVRLPGVRWTAGTVDGQVSVVVWRRGQATAVDYQGRLELHDVGALTAAGPVLSQARGPVEVDPVRVITPGLTVSLDGRPVWVRGEIRRGGGLYVDLAARAGSVPLRTLRRWLPAGAAVDGTASGEVRVFGPLDRPVVDAWITQASGRLAGWTVSEFAGRLHYAGGVLAVGGAAAGPAGRVRGWGVLTATGDLVTAVDVAGVRLDALRVPAGIRLPDLAGLASGRLLLARQGADMAGHLRVEADSLRVGTLAVDRVEAVGGATGGQLDLDRAEVRLGPGLVRLAGGVAPSGQIAVSLMATDVNLRRVASALGIPWVAGTADFRGELTGSPAAPQLRGDIAVYQGQAGPLPFDSLTGPVLADRAGLRTPGLTVSDGEGVYRVAGAVGWHPPSLDLVVQARSLSVQRLLDIAKIPLDMAGTAEGRIRLSGTPADPQVEGALSLRDAVVFGQPVDRAVAAVRLTGEDVTIDEAVLEINASRVWLQGTVSRRGEVAVSFEARGFHLADLAALRGGALRVEGDADLVGTLGGSLRAPVVDARLASTTLVLNGQPFDQAEGTVRYRRSRLVLQPLVLVQGGGRTELTGAVLLTPDPVVDLHAVVEGMRVPPLLAMARAVPRTAVDGRVDGEIVASGRLSDPDVALVVRISDGRLGDHPVREAIVDVVLTDRVATVRSLVVRPEQGVLVGAGRVDLAGQTDVEVSAQGIDLDLLRPLLGLPVPLSGSLDATVQLTGPPGALVVGISASVTDGGVVGARFQRLTLQAYYRNGDLVVEQGLAQQDRHRIKVSGRVPVELPAGRVDPGRPLDLRAALVDGDLSFLLGLAPWIEEASGPVQGEVVVSGTAQQPQVSGSVTITGGRLRLRGVELPLEDLEATLHLSGDELRLVRLRARAGGGDVAGSGTMTLRRFTPDRVTAEATLRGVRARVPDLLDAVVDADLSLAGPVAGPILSGTVTLSGGDLYVPQASPSRPRARAAMDPALDVAVRAGEDLWANVGRLRVLVHGGVRAAGTWTSPRLSGEVESERGTFAAFNTTFALTEARAGFAEFRGTVPEIDARAETTMQLVTQVVTATGTERRLETVRVFLHIAGTPDDLAVDLTSDPPLTREEILAGLAGRVGVTRLLQGQDVEAVVRAELGAAVFGGVGRAVARAFGLEEFTITYDVERPLLLRLGKAVVRNLYVTLTSELGVTQRYVWSLEYRLTPATMLSFSVDNQGGYDLFLRMVRRF
ncbi:MAG: translocation/assembly module TamB domain-containing protein [Armatimonadota bacterium]|nr:translocation/assembly module TamB domain-containing protein [Armatimonadota bacterium]MDR7509458.1 translocation/assembly module TamB domain-containing protein [Armatimonadota bacterium]MDR7516816.1 translocation/assembly module TamB domain-containing protein [Armatimonadota bacterium]MDR7561445.1 translocation/assembly module TamB domain-containing protein [Armatimonadota bacterium]MDR7588485.1 translocation/assembly module TamB domain-containing protein [Armatimonadota bacterium]